MILYSTGYADGRCELETSLTERCTNSTDSGRCQTIQSVMENNYGE
jgi:hypothetical protein